MSTLKVTTLQDTAGGNSSTSEEIYSGRAKAWVNFNGTGTVAIRADFNVNTITDFGTGDYGVNFSNPLSDANYCVSGSAGNSSSAIGAVAPTSGGSGPTTTASRIFTRNFSNNPFDSLYVNISIFR